MGLACDIVNSIAKYNLQVLLRRSARKECSFHSHMRVKVWLIDKRNFLASKLLL